MMTWSKEMITDVVPPSPEVIEETAIAMAQATIQAALNESNVSRSDLAKRMGRPRSFITKMLKGDHNLTIRTFARALAGCGYELRYSYQPIEATTVVQPTIIASQIVSKESSNDSANNSNFALVA